MRQLPLPLWQRVIFVDWHGVLSRDPFWTSILNNDRHRLRASLQARLGQVFSQPVSHDWMRGAVTSEEIIAQMAVDLPPGYGKDFLRRRLDEDCRKMRVNVDLFRLLSTARSQALVVIATDNMDCFKIAFEGARRSPGRPPTTSRLLMRDWAAHGCDDIVCSTDVRTLKADDPHGFFSPFLKHYGLDFPNAALIDDRQDNCEAFEAAGGTPLRYKMSTDDIDSLQTKLANWLREDTPPTASRPGADEALVNV